MPLHGQAKFMLLFFKPEFITAEAYSEICTHDNSKFLFPNKYRFHFCNRRLQPLKIRRSSLSSEYWEYPPGNEHFL